VNTATVSSDREKYGRLRDELWWAMRERCMKQQYSFACATSYEREMSQELCNELAQPTYEFNNIGGAVVESKRKMKIRGVASPNIADALAITEYFYNSAYSLWGPKVSKKRKAESVQPKPWKQRGRVSKDSWMTV